MFHVFSQHPSTTATTTLTPTYLLGSLWGPALLEPNLRTPPVQPLRGPADLHLCLDSPTLWCSTSCLACRRLWSRPSLRGLWQNLQSYDQQHVVFSAHYHARLTTGRFKSPKKKKDFPPWCGQSEALCPGFLCLPCPKDQRLKRKPSLRFSIVYLRTHIGPKNTLSMGQNILLHPKHRDEWSR